MNNADMQPSTNAAAMISGTVMTPVAVAEATAASVAKRTTSTAIIVRRRFQRSSHTPACNCSTRKGRVAANPASPAWAGECATASTSSG